MLEETSHFPQLKFPNFSEPWTEVAMKDVFSNFRKKGDSSLPIYSVSQSLGMIPRESLDRTIQQNAKPEQNLRVEPDDIAYNMMRMWQGAFGVSKITCMISPAYVVLKPRKHISSQFFKYQFSRNRTLYLFGAYSHGLTKDRLRLYFHDFGTIKTVIPEYDEQQKIASFLSSVDERIELLEQKKEKLEAYKKGVMQQIFSQQIRFKKDEGSDFPDWEERKLGEIGSTYGGLSGKSKEDFGSGKSYIQYMQIFSNTKIDPSQFGLVEIREGEKQNLVQVGDVFFTISSETPKEIGTASVLTQEVGEVFLNSFCFGFRPNSLEILNPMFSRYLFRSPAVRKQIIKLAQGSTRYNMSKVEFLKLPVRTPNLEEQKKIAAFISSLDENLETIGAQMQNLKSWKKGLLQQMFI